MNAATSPKAVADRLGLPIDEALILQAAHARLLVAAASGEVDLNALARQELASRGIDANGRWIGFPAAERAWLSPARAAVQQADADYAETLERYRDAGVPEEAARQSAEATRRLSLRVAGARP